MNKAELETEVIACLADFAEYRRKRSLSHRNLHKIWDQLGVIFEQVKSEYGIDLEDGDSEFWVSLKLCAGMFFRNRTNHGDRSSHLLNTLFDFALQIETGREINLDWLE
jgi:hypothetical protein